MSAIRRRVFGGFAAMAVALLATAANASANIIQVTSTADDGTGCTLREAINNANNDSTGDGCTAGSGDDTVEFQTGLTGTIALGSEISAGVDGGGTLTIDGPGVDVITVSGQDASRIFHIPMNADAVTVNGLTISHGRVSGSNGGNGGGIVADDGTDLTLDHVVLSDNSVRSSSTTAGFNFASAIGGAVFSKGDMDLIDSSVNNNLARATATGGTNNLTTAWGGGVGHYQAGGSLNVLRSTFNGNLADSVVTAPTGGEGALGGALISNAATTTVAESTFDGNAVGATIDTDAAQGGAIWANGPFALRSDTIAGNGINGPGAGSSWPGNLVWNGVQPTLQNTIIAQPGTNNRNCAELGGTGDVTTLGHNFADDGTCNPTGTGDSSTFNASVGLLALADNGGPTKTRLPALHNMTDQSVIDQGVAAGDTVEQRGKQRTWDFTALNGTGGDGTDVGAVEVQGPAITASNPASPGNAASPQLSGTSDGTVRLYTDSSCSTGTGVAAVASFFASPGITVDAVAANSSTDYYAQSSYGNVLSPCSSPLFNYMRVPSAPSLSVTPVSGTDADPTVQGTTLTGTTVDIYSGSSCAGSPLQTGVTQSQLATGVTESVSNNTSTTFTAKATGAGGTSACSTPVAYARPPTAPSLTVTPASGSDDNQPKIQGTTMAATTVDIYSGSTCAGAPLQTGVTQAQLSTGVAQSVADNSTTTFSARASGAGGTSACSSPVSYTEVTPPPPTPVTPAATTPASTTPAPKKCKKGRKLKKGKCVKKKKKK